MLRRKFAEYIAEMSSLAVIDTTCGWMGRVKTSIIPRVVSTVRDVTVIKSQLPISTYWLSEGIVEEKQICPQLRRYMGG